MRVVQILSVAVMLFVCVELAVVRKDNEIACHCAVYGENNNAQMIVAEDPPLLKKSVNIEAECNEDGAKKCGAQCKALGEAAAAEDSQELCEAIMEMQLPLHLTYYSMICDARTWTYTGLTGRDDYCCFEYRHAICNVTEADYDYYVGDWRIYRLPINWR